MDDFDSPLDLDGDGDDAIEMSLLFDEDGVKKGSGKQPPGSNGCCVALLLFGGAMVATCGLVKMLIQVHFFC